MSLDLLVQMATVYLVFRRGKCREDADHFTFLGNCPLTPPLSHH